MLLVDFEPIKIHSSLFSNPYKEFMLIVKINYLNSRGLQSKFEF